MPGFDFFQTSPITGNTDLLGPGPELHYTPILTTAPAFIPSGQVPPSVAPTTLTSSISPSANTQVASVLNNIAALIQGPQAQGSVAGGVITTGSNSPNAPSLVQSLTNSTPFWVGIAAIGAFLAWPYLKRGRR